jgi:two-component system response regulator MprA
VLLIDDDEALGALLTEYLDPFGFAVKAVAQPDDGLHALAADPPDIVVLDVMLPGMDGFAVCRKVRETSRVPIVMLTARGELDDRVRGLDLGADDYIAKPFHFAELLARVRAHLRRAAADGPERVMQLADLTLDPRSRDVRRGSRPIELTTREFELLTLLLQNPGRVLSKETILDRLWGYAFDDNLVEVYIGYLRRKLGQPDLIQTHRGAGYALREPG